MADITRLVTAAASLCALALLTGCHTPVAVRDPGPFVGNQAAAWESVLPPAGSASAAALAFVPSAMPPEFSRRDAALGVIPAEPYTVADAFDTRRDVPRLDDLRRLYLSTTNNTILYYRSQGRTIGYR